MDKKLLKACLVRYGDTQKNLADRLGISLSCLNAKINSKSEFVQSEIAFIKKQYNLSPCDVNAIFFSSRES